MTGGLVLLSREDLAEKISHRAAPFAAGALLGAAFLDLLPEASKDASEPIFGWALTGMVAFFLLERFVLEFHHQHTHDHDEHSVADAAVPLVVIGDVVHNFIDGIVIAGTFLASIPLGIVTTFVVAAHEIPQEIGDFGLLLHRGVSRKKVLIYNVLGGLATVVAAVMTYFVGARITALLPIFLAITAGFFIYIAASDLIPEIHRHRGGRADGVIDTLLLAAGITIIWATVQFLH